MVDLGSASGEVGEGGGGRNASGEEGNGAEYDGGETHVDGLIELEGWIVERLDRLEGRVGGRLEWWKAGLVLL